MIKINKNVSIESMTKDSISFDERMYKSFTARAIELQETLNKTPKIFKCKRKELEQEIKQMQTLANKHYKDFITECNYFYDLHTKYKEKEDKLYG